MNSLYNKYLRALKFFSWRVVDFDWKYANQCVDWVKAYAKSLGYRITTSWNAKDFASIWLWKNWSRVYTMPWVWDIVVFPTWIYWHIAVVKSVLWNKIYVIEQNRDWKAYANNIKDNLWSPISNWEYRLKGNEVYFRVNS